MLSFFVVPVVGVFTFYAYWYLKCKILFPKLPGYPPTFPLGNLSWVIGIYSKVLVYHPAVYILERMTAFSILFHKPGFYAFFSGLTPVVTVHKAEVLEKVLNSTTSLEKSFEYKFLHNWLGRGLLTSSGSKWRNRRKLLTPAFHFRILEDFLPVFNDQSLVLIEKLRSTLDKEYVDITPLVTLCTLDIVCETVMGVHIGAQKGENFEYVRAVHNLGDLFVQRMIRPWHWNDFLYGLTATGRAYFKDLSTLHSFTKKVIKEKKESILSNLSVDGSDTSDTNELQRKKRKTFMDLLLQLHIQGQNLSEEDIREEVDTFMFEGHDTTALGIIYALYFIGLYPDIQNRIVEEVDAIFSDDTERCVSHDDIRNMKYLECTLKESQRLCPSVPLIGRKLQENLNYDDMIIPKGTEVHCNIFALHRDASVFPNPEVFDPSRFLSENSIERHPYAYVPFSAGPRNCIGQKFAMMEEKVVISNILRHFVVISIDPRDKIHAKIEFTLRPAQPMRLKFIPR